MVENAKNSTVLAWFIAHQGKWCDLVVRKNKDKKSIPKLGIRSRKKEDRPPTNDERDKKAVRQALLVIASV